MSIKCYAHVCICKMMFLVLYESFANVQKELD